MQTMKLSPYSSHYDHLRAWMKKKREESGLSIRAVAEVLGRYPSVIGKMEQDRKIEIVEFIQYCHAVGADPHEGVEMLIKSLRKAK